MYVYTYLRLVDVELGVRDAEECVRLGDPEQRDVVVFEDVLRVNVLDVLAAEVVQLVVLDDGVAAAAHDVAELRRVLVRPRELSFRPIKNSF